MMMMQKQTELSAQIQMQWDLNPFACRIVSKQKTQNAAHGK